MPIPLSVEVIVVVPCLLCKAGCVERGVVYSKFVIANSSVEVPFVGGHVWT